MTVARTTKRTAPAHAARAFVLALLAGLVLTGCMEWTRLRQEQDRMGYIASSIGAETYEFMLSEMSKARVLEAYLIQTGGDYSDFGKVAHVLLREDYVRNVLFAPGGVVDGVFPLEGNEGVVGLDMYGDGAGNLEAQAAIEKEELFIAGPFQLIQGGLCMEAVEHGTFGGEVIYGTLQNGALSAGALSDLVPADVQEKYQGYLDQMNDGTFMQ